MLRMKSFFAVLLLAAIAGVMPQASAQTVKVMIAGSSALWQTLALGAYNGGTSISGGTATGHWTSASNRINLTDTRPSPVNNDPGTIWVVWDNASPRNVWAFIKVDSVVGVRCYFAQPHCNVSGITAADVTTSGSNQISTTLWGDGSSDTAMPAEVAALFTPPTAQLVSVAATDIRPEDAAFAECRVNSQLGNGTPGSGDGLDGLGYGTKAPGICPVLGDPQTAKVGNPIKSGITGSTTQANVLAFNITGKDPFSNTTIPTATVTSVGAAPIVFITERKNELANLTNATESQLQNVFSGANCDASAFGLPSGGINIFLREPLSGTMNTTEATVFRRPTVPASKGVLGKSQELRVGANNPLKGQAGTCAAGGGARYRGVGTGEVVGGVQHSDDGTRVPTQSDGITYTFFSYGNVSAIANNPNYGYITLNGIDPIFQTYGASNIDPGQPATAGTLPAAANLPASCSGAFPCSEHNIWGNGFSFPNVRSGLYRSWSLLRLVSSGTPNTNAKALVTASQKYVVNSVPDYIPAAAVAGTTDLGLKLVRSHYQQKDGNGNNIGPAPLNTGADKGGDMGGQILSTVIGVTTSKQTQLIQNSNSDSSNLGPVVR